MSHNHSLNKVIGYEMHVCTNIRDIFNEIYCMRKSVHVHEYEIKSIYGTVRL
jgi:hypothetical protein